MDTELISIKLNKKRLLSQDIEIQFDDTVPKRIKMNNSLEDKRHDTLDDKDLSNFTEAIQNFVGETETD